MKVLTKDSYEYVDKFIACWNDAPSYQKLYDVLRKEWPNDHINIIRQMAESLENNGAAHNGERRYYLNSCTEGSTY